MDPPWERPELNFPDPSNSTTPPPTAGPCDVLGSWSWCCSEPVPSNPLGERPQVPSGRRGGGERHAFLGAWPGPSSRGPVLLSFGDLGLQTHSCLDGDQEEGCTRSHFATRAVPSAEPGAVTPSGI